MIELWLRMINMFKYWELTFADDELWKLCEDSAILINLAKTSSK